MSIKISPSILSANFVDIAAAVKTLATADMIHCDVMDGHFVPNITFGPKMVGDLRKVTSQTLDVHLMITDPQLYIPTFAAMGADIITFHMEAVSDPCAVLKKIHELGIKGGVVINPETSAGVITEEIATLCDIILVMSVHPGFGGQKFIPDALPKLRVLRAMLDKVNPSCMLEIDGGITFENVSDCVSAGADVIVAGNTIFKEEDRAAAIRELKSCARS